MRLNTPWNRHYIMTVIVCVNQTHSIVRIHSKHIFVGDTLVISIWKRARPCTYRNGRLRTGSHRSEQRSGIRANLAQLTLLMAGVNESVPFVSVSTQTASVCAYLHLSFFNNNGT